MRAERWKRVDELLDAAMGLAPAERAALLEEACAGDEDLRREVESLLDAHDRAGDFIEGGALEAAARNLAAEQSELNGSAQPPPATSVGRRFGHYQILSLLGAGGMGEVYLARDTRLGRLVALKLLPARFTDDPERVRRFEREARAASALNHPNIITIYDIGAHEGAHYIATEFVDGRTLRRHAAEARPDLHEALGLALQIADALAAAHEAGIVHRDVKPENVMVRRDGYVKVLDFGLAKLAERTEHEGNAEGQSAAALTVTGAVMGTYAYMSPEQSLGREVDARSDIFSLGVVLYELVEGKHPFRGPTAAATFDAILNREPPPLEHASSELMTELERVVARALEKDRELRYQTASDLRAELKRLRRDLDSATSVSGKSSRNSAPRRTRRARPSKAFVALVCAAVFAVLMGFVYIVTRWLNSETRPNPAPLGNLSFTPLTDQPGAELSPSLSPDGKTFVYAAKPADNWDIFAQRAGGRSARNLTADTKEDDAQPAFSPDGERIAFRSERQKGGLFVMGADGESVRRLTDFGHHPAWSPDGREVVFCKYKIEDPNDRYLDPSALWAVNVSTGVVRPVTEEGAGDAVQPQWSPTGARIVYWGKHKAGQRDIWTVSARGGTPVAVTDDAPFDWNPVWSPDGRYVYFSSDRGGSMNLWRVPVEEATGRVTGAPESVTAPSRYAFHLSFSRDGRRAVFVNQTSSTHIYKAAFNPHREALMAPPVAVTRGFRHTSTPDLSPDGEWFAYSSQGETREDIYVIDKDGATAPRQLTDDEYKDRDPRWSPDGKSIVFYSNRTGKYEAWAVNADGSNPRQLTFTEGANVAYPFWSPDGTRLVFNRSDRSSTVVEVGRPWGDQQPRPLPPVHGGTLGGAWCSSWSPDGTRLGCWLSPRADNPGIYLYTFATDSYERLTNFGVHPRWFEDNRKMLFYHQGTLHMVNAETKKVTELVSPPPPYRVIGFGISKDNRTIFYGLSSTDADVWLINL